jgi:hypothetical protein
MEGVYNITNGGRKESKEQGVQQSGTGYSRKVDNTTHDKPEYPRFMTTE